LIWSSCLATPQQSATDWIQRGQQIESPEEKITCFQQAVALDSNLAAGYYYMGLSYLELDQLQLAQSRLNQGLLKSQPNAAAAWDVKCLIGLAQVHRRQRRFDLAQQELNQAQPLTRDPELLSYIAYDLGSIYLLRSQFQAAIPILTEGQNLFPPMTTKFNQALALARSEGQIEKWYRQANEFYAQKNWAAALEKFEMVAGIEPNYKETSAKIAAIKQTLSPKVQERTLDEIYAQWITQLLKQDFANALITFQRIAALKPDFKDVQEKLQFLEQQRANTREATDLRQFYEQGLQALTDRQWVTALFYFEQISTQNPAYLDVAKQVELVKNELLKIKSASMTSENATATLMSEQIQPDTRNWSGDTLDYFQYYYQAGQKFSLDRRWLQAVIAFEKAKSFREGDDSLETQLKLARQKLRDQNPLEIEPIQFNVASGQNWRLGLWVTLGVVFISSLGFFLWRLHRQKKSFARQYYHDWT
jgi:tetratricopeptide (TPR) repeat protein